MYSIARVFGTFKDYYMSNVTTTIDVIVVKTPEEEFVASPLHLCMNIPAFISDRYYKFDIKINGKAKDIELRYRDTGEACLLEEVSEVVPSENRSESQPSLNGDPSDNAQDQEYLAELRLCGETVTARKLESHIRKTKSLSTIDKTSEPVNRSASENILLSKSPKNQDTVSSDPSPLPLTNAKKKDYRSDGEIDSDLTDDLEGKNLSLAGENNGNQTAVALNEAIEKSQIADDKKSPSVHWLLNALLNIIRISSLSKPKTGAANENEPTEEKNEAGDKNESVDELSDKSGGELPATDEPDGNLKNIDECKEERENDSLESLNETSIDKNDEVMDGNVSIDISLSEKENIDNNSVTTMLGDLPKTLELDSTDNKENIDCKEANKMIESKANEQILETYFVSISPNIEPNIEKKLELGNMKLLHDKNLNNNKTEVNSAEVVISEKHFKDDQPPDRNFNEKSSDLKQICQKRIIDEETFTRQNSKLVRKFIDPQTGTVSQQDFFFASPREAELALLRFNKAKSKENIQESNETPETRSNDNNNSNSDTDNTDEASVSNASLATNTSVCSESRPSITDASSETVAGNDLSFETSSSKTHEIRPKTVTLSSMPSYQSIDETSLLPHISLAEDKLTTAAASMYEKVSLCTHTNFSCSYETESFDESKFLNGLMASEMDLMSLDKQKSRTVSDVRLCQSNSIDKFVSAEGDLYPALALTSSRTSINIDSLKSQEMSPRDPPNIDGLIQLSLCGFGPDREISLKSFEEHSLDLARLYNEPELFASSKLVARLNGRCYPWSMAGPLLALYVMSGKEPPRQTIDKLQDLFVNERKLCRHKSESVSKRSWWQWRSKCSLKSTPSSICNEPSCDKDKEKTKDKDTVSSGSRDSVDPQKLELKSITSAESLKSQSNEAKADEKYLYSHERMFKFSSNVLKKLDLQEGKNLLEFTITSCQRSVNYKCFIYLWSHNDKIIVSDIDGTITKSDVLGHILPMVGKDWSQLGVAPLFNRIVQNGYKILYVSSRAWNQVKHTRDYISWVRQDNIALPDGPILLSPDSMFDTLHRELIEKKPEIFKIACLADIGTLFADKNPFYAGFGNRFNDLVAYQHIGIPMRRIFIVNFKGEIAFSTIPVRSSYLNMINLVDFIFSPSNATSDDNEVYDFTQNIYWRDPIYEIGYPNEFEDGGTAALTLTSASGTRPFKFPFTN